MFSQNTGKKPGQGKKKTGKSNKELGVYPKKTHRLTNRRIEKDRKSKRQIKSDRVVKHPKKLPKKRKGGQRGKKI